MTQECKGISFITRGLMQGKRQDGFPRQPPVLLCKWSKAQRLKRVYKVQESVWEEVWIETLDFGLQCKIHHIFFKKTFHGHQLRVLGINNDNFKTACTRKYSIKHMPTYVTSSHVYTLKCSHIYHPFPIQLSLGYQDHTQITLTHPSDANVPVSMFISSCLWFGV